jgi:hypothetical protein
MIQITYKMVCDNCKRKLPTVFYTEHFARLHALECAWTHVDGRDLCRDCSDKLQAKKDAEREKEAKAEKALDSGLAEPKAEMEQAYYGPRLPLSVPIKAHRKG